MDHLLKLAAGMPPCLMASVGRERDVKNHYLLIIIIDEMRCQSTGDHHTGTHHDFLHQGNRKRCMIVYFHG
jgi:hypothetical protein